MYKKPGFPEVGEFAICKVKEVQQHSVFLDLEEYDNKHGMLHTSEISRRLIRTLRVFFKPGRTLVCKVMDVDQDKNHINLSHRRVGGGQERYKLKEWANEKRIDDLLQVFAKRTKLDIQDVYARVLYKVLNKYGPLYPVFLEVARGEEELLDKCGIDKKLASKLIELIKQRITIPKAEIKGTLIMKSEAPDGLEVIKKAVSDAENTAKKLNVELDIKYIGAPKYRFVLKSKELTGAEKAFESILSVIKKVVGKAEFKRE